MSVSRKGFIGKGPGGQLHQIGDTWVGDQPEFGQVRAQRIRRHGPLAHNQRSGSVRHQNTLLLNCLYRHKPHCRTLHGLADRFCINRIAFAALDVTVQGIWKPMQMKSWL